MIDEEAKARRAAEFFNAQNVDLVFCHAATYALSAAHLAIARHCRRPLVLLNLIAGRGDELREDDDRRMAGALRGLLRAGDRQRVDPPRLAVPPGQRSAGAGSHARGLAGRREYGRP